MKSLRNLKTLLAISVFVVAVSSRIVPGAVIYVDADATDGGDGTSWANAYKYLQDAMAAAGFGDVIWVAEGFYRPDQDAANPSGTNDRNATFQLFNRIWLYGGFAGTETSSNQRNLQTNETTLTGDIGILGDNSDNCYHVVMAGMTWEEPILDGFTITGGNADGGEWDNDGGGGMYIECGVYSPVVRNCTFRGNSAERWGGGMYNKTDDTSFSNSPTVTNCTFYENHALKGGGMHNVNSNTIVTNCTFSENSAEYGGGMYNYYSDPTLTECTFSGNSAETVGGGMHNEISNTIVTDCIFSENSSEHGGGIYNFSNDPTLTECTFSGNTAETFGGGMINTYSSATLTNCIFSRNSAGTFGGGMYSYVSSLTATNCTFSTNSAGISGGGMSNDHMFSSTSVINCSFIGNRAEGEDEDSGGGAMSNDYYCSPDIRNCTFTNNSATNNGGALYGKHVVMNLYNSILWGNEASNGPEIAVAVESSLSVNYCDLQDGLSGISAELDCTVELSHTIYDDPLFQDADGRLSWASPCINAGDDDTVPSGLTTDLDGNPRIIGSSVDMGAYEANWDIDADGIANTIDTDPFVYSDDFDDEAVPINTYGSIIHPHTNREVAITDLPDPEGVWIETTGPSETRVRICDENTVMTVNNEIDALACTCTNSSLIEVVRGTVEIVFFADDGRVATTSLNAGNSLLFDPEAFTIVAGNANIDIVVVIVDGQAYSIIPGETKTFATINIDPDTLNLKSKEKWITCYIELPEGLEAADIDVSTVELNGVQAQSHPTEIGDYDLDGVVDLMVKFDKAAVQETLEVGDKVLIIVTGELSDGTVFEGHDTIRVIN